MRPSVAFSSRPLSIARSRVAFFVIARRKLNRKQEDLTWWQLICQNQLGMYPTEARVPNATPAAKCSGRPQRVGSRVVFGAEALAAGVLIVVAPGGRQYWLSWLVSTTKQLVITHRVVTATYPGMVAAVTNPAVVSG